jgi:spermidine synthase
MGEQPTPTWVPGALRFFILRGSLVSFLPFETCVYDNGNVMDRVQVFEHADRWELRFGNSIVQSAKSKQAPDLLLLEYTRALLTGLLFAPDNASILHIGLGAGTIPDFIHRHFPQARQRVVELNRDVIAVAERYFGLPRSARLDVVQDDGINHLRVARDLFDLVVFDAFHANGAAPQMTTKTAFQLAQKRLKPGGWLVNNAWGSDAGLLHAITMALRELFSEVHLLSVRMHSNVILIAGSPSSPTRLATLRDRAAALSARMPLDFQPWLKQLASGVQNWPALVSK